MPKDIAMDDRLDVTVNAEVEPTEPRRVVVGVTAKNLGPREVFVLHRLWVADMKGNRTWDPEVVYRFVDKGSLRLLFGPSPISPNMSVNDPQLPHATKLAPGEKLALKVELTAPIQEYCLFFPASLRSKLTPTRVHRIDVITQFAVPEDGVIAKPSFIDPQAFWMSMGRSQLRSTHTSLEVSPFESMRREGFIERPKLPGE